MVYLAGLPSGRVVPAHELAKHACVSTEYLHKLTRELQKSGLVRSARGQQGGFYLCKPANEVSLYDVLISAEGTMSVNRCVANPDLCSRGAAEHCKVHDRLAILQGQMEDYLKSVSIATLSGADCQGTSYAGLGS